MAEARSEGEETNLRRRDTREQVVRRQPNSSGARPDRHKPEHRHSQGPLSSIRAVIKRTTRPISVIETPRDPARDRDRERERDRDRDRDRERDRDRDRERDRDRDRERDRDRRRPEITILSAEPLPSASWFPGVAAGIPPPPPPPAQIWGPTIHPSVEPPPSYEEVIREKTQEQVLLPTSSSPVSRTTIAIQTDPRPDPDPEEAQKEKPAKPPRPPLPDPLKSSNVDDITSAASQSAALSSDADSVATHTHSEERTHPSTGCSDLLADLCLPLTSTCGAQTDQSVQSSSAPADASHVPVERPRPRPRPRTKLGRQLIRNEVKVQTLVKLREDGLATLAAQASSSSSSKQGGGQGKYLQELLEAFSSDDWGFPDHRSDSSEHSQSESEEEGIDDMAALRARIQMFEQQVADGSCGDDNDRQTGTSEDIAVGKRPEPRPRSRLQGQLAKSVPPVTAPKPKSISPVPKPSNKEFWEGEDLTAGAPTGTKPSEPRPTKPSIAPKPQSVSPPPPPVAVPAARPPPPKLTPSLPNPTAPPRPSVTPRVSLGAPLQDGSTVEVGGGAEPLAATQTVTGGSSQTKPATLTSARRFSAPCLAPKTISVPPTQPDPHPASVSTPGPTPTPPARRVSVLQANVDPTSPDAPSRSKPLPLRPPPIKSAPERPPPPAINSAPSANRIAVCKATPTADQCSQTAASPPAGSANQTQKAAKRGPPLPPRPKPGHPLYDSYMKQDVLIVLDDPPPTPSDEGGVQTTTTPLINPSQGLLDQDTQPKTAKDEDIRSKPALDVLSDQQSILSLQPAEQKQQSEPPPVSGPRCLALFDYEGEEEDELTFSQGDVIVLLEIMGEEWGRGQIHGQAGIFPLNFTDVVEPLPVMTPSEESFKPEWTGELKRACVQEWAVALFDFPGQTTEDLPFHKGALIQVLEHIDAEWRRGRLEGREGLYPVAFTRPSQAQPITDQHSAVKGTAKVLSG
ncbi:transcript variant X1 [Nothobranchius furzeri]|uniref:Transcript variant X1 n=1 Tax=Nothobranchius furzeri TaxID=105023 RepID=A0A9D2YZW9_NOTFU|nr:transcript variant X1 [Nothobranchius furzeri]